MFVKPGINPETGQPFRVRIPHTFALLAEDGQEVADDMFWRWMLRHGDVILADPPEPEAAAETEPGAEAEAASAPVPEAEPAPAKPEA